MDNQSDFLGIRRREFREAFDLGTIMFQRFLPQEALFFGVPYVVMAVLLILLCEPIPWLSLLLLWWLKPLWDRLILLPASVLLYRPKASVGDLFRTLRALRGSSLLKDLSIHRFSLLRPFLLPAKALEGLKGSALRNRLRLLARDRVGAVAWLTIFFLCVEILLTFSWLPLILSISEAIFDRLFQTNFSTFLSFTILYSVGVLFLEPLYVLGGFGLYLDRRMTLEGWDLDLAFRRMRLRTEAEKSKMPGNKKFLGLVMVLFFFGTAPRIANAEDMAVRVPPAARTTEVSFSPEESEWEADAQWILSNPDFGGTEEVRTWVIRERPQKNKPMRPLFNLSVPLVLLSTYGGRALLVVVIIAGLGAAALVAYSFFKNATPSEKPPAQVPLPEPEKNDELSRIDSLDSWPSRSLSLWNEGRHHEALVLLFKVALTKIEGDLLSLKGDAFYPSAAMTENEALSVLRGVEGSSFPQKEALSAVFFMRIQESYGLRPIEDAAFLRVRAGLLEVLEGEGPRL